MFAWKVIVIGYHRCNGSWQISCESVQRICSHNSPTSIIPTDYRPTYSCIQRCEQYHAKLWLESIELLLNFCCNTDNTHSSWLGHYHQHSRWLHHTLNVQWYIGRCYTGTDLLCSLAIRTVISHIFNRLITTDIVFVLYTIHYKVILVLRVKRLITLRHGVL